MAALPSLCPSCMADGSAELLRALDDAGPAPVAHRPAVRGIVAHAAALFGVTAGEIVGRRRLKRIVRPRQAAAWVAREATGRSWPEIGRLIGGRDHSTMIHAAVMAGEHAARDPEFAWAVERLWASAECEPWGPGGVAAALLPSKPEPLPAIYAGLDAAPAEPVPPPVVAIVRPGEYVPRHALPPVLAVVDPDLEAPDPGAGDDLDAHLRSCGSDRLIAALRREHPERCAA